MEDKNKTIGDLLYWAYANLAMTHAALKNNDKKYGPKHYAIRMKLFKGLKNSSMDIKSFFDDERLKMILPQACCYCGSSDHLAADHVIPRRKGGKDIGENLIWACRICNSSKRDRDLMTWILSKDQFPSVLLYRRYLKNVITYCRDNELIRTSINDTAHLNLPFDISSIPTDAIPLSEASIWITDLYEPNQSIEIHKKYRIANWNVERPQNLGKKTQLAIDQIQEINADVLVLTETSSIIKVSDEYEFIASDEVDDLPNENWAIIYSKWKIIKQIKTFNSTRSVCAILDSPFGEVIIYATIIPYHMAGVRKGKYGNLGYKAWQMHEEDIINQSEDWKNILRRHPNIPIIIMGDFNQTRDSLPKGYGTKKCRDLLTGRLNDLNLICVTEEDFSATGKLSIDSKKGRVKRNVDHICISQSFLNRTQSSYVGAWDHFTDEGKFMSDHNGVYFDFDI